MLKKIKSKVTGRTQRKTWNVYLHIIDGQHSERINVDEHNDRGKLVYKKDGDWQTCAITSNPTVDLDTGDKHYFSKDGFLGTMALNRDTLLSSDAYDPQSNKVTSLQGSKTKLDRLNNAERAVKLLNPQTMDKSQFLMAAGAGAAAAFLLTQFL